MRTAFATRDIGVALGLKNRSTESRSDEVEKLFCNIPETVLCVFPFLHSAGICVANLLGGGGVALEPARTLPRFDAKLQRQ